MQIDNTLLKLIKYLGYHNFLEKIQKKSDQIGDGFVPSSGNDGHEMSRILITPDMYPGIAKILPELFTTEASKNWMCDHFDSSDHFGDRSFFSDGSFFSDRSF